MTDMVDLEEWKENEKFSVLHAIFKLMTPEQRNIVTIRSKCVCTLKLIVTDYCVFMCQMNGKMDARQVLKEAMEVAEDDESHRGVSSQHVEAMFKLIVEMHA